MKISTYLTILVAALVIKNARGDLVIEQEVETTGQPKQTMTMSFKDGKIRADIGKAMSTITDSATGDTTAIMHEQKMVMKTSGAATKAAVDAAQKQLAGTEKPKKLAEGETINGRHCECWQYDIGGSKTVMWVDKAYPGYAEFKAEMDKLTTAQQKSTAAAFDLGGMVVKTESVMAGMTSSTVVKSVTQTPLDDSIFKAPADYTEMNLGK
jgi:Domain of unknown function (DUF4412)